MLALFRQIVTILLSHEGDCKLLGITDTDLIFAEELYGDDDWLAQHKILMTEGVLDSIDESWGQNADIKVLELPTDLIKPASHPCCEVLTYTGARWRGLQSDERIHDIALPLSIEEKIQLVDYMEWDGSPMQLIGIVESIVLAHAILSEGLYVVCRRLKIAYRLTEPIVENDITYDYDSLELYLLHEFHPTGDMPSLVDCLDDIDDVALLRPMDCLYHKGRLYVADGGEGEDVSAIHVFERQENL